MKGRKAAVAMAIAIGVLGSSAIGATAQNEAAAPTEFTARWVFGPRVRSQTTDGTDPVRYRGGANRPSPVAPASDPRFAGEVNVAVNRDHYESSGALQVFHRAFSVTNDEGTWRGVPHVYLNFSEPESSSGATQLFIGEGGYEGLYAIVDITTDGKAGVWWLHGVIFEGEPPPAPEPFVFE